MTNEDAEKLVPSLASQDLGQKHSRYGRALRATPVGESFVAYKADRKRISALGYHFNRRIRFEEIVGATNLVRAVIVGTVRVGRMAPPTTLSSAERRIAKRFREQINNTAVGSSFVALTREVPTVHKLARIARCRIRVKPIEGFTRLVDVVVEARAPGAKLPFGITAEPRKYRRRLPLRIISAGTAMLEIGVPLVDQLYSLPIGFDLMVPKGSYSRASVVGCAKHAGVLVNVHAGKNPNWMRVHRLSRRQPAQNVLAKLVTLKVGESLETWKKWMRRLHSYARHKDFAVTTESISAGRIRVTKLALQ